MCAAAHAVAGLLSPDAGVLSESFACGKSPYSDPSIVAEHQRGCRAARLVNEASCSCTCDLIYTC